MSDVRDLTLWEISAGHSLTGLCVTGTSRQSLVGEWGMDESVDTPSARTIARALTAAAVVTWGSLILFFIVGGPFGTINDLGNGVLAVLCGVLALLLHSRRRIAATMFAAAGAAISVFGSFLVLSNTAGYFFAGLVSASGFGLIGIWLLVISRSGDLPASRSALIAGAVMALGIVNVAGVVEGRDDQDAAPGWLVAAGVCWAGTYLLLPMWAIRFARSSPGHSRHTGV